MWAEILPPVLRKGLLDAVHALECETRALRVAGKDPATECAGILYWWPTGWDAEHAGWIVESRFQPVLGAGGVGSFRIVDTGVGEEILHSIIDQVSRLGPGLEEHLSEIQWLFGLVHTHPGSGGDDGDGGTPEVSPQDLLAEVAFDEWRAVTGGYAVGKPSSFVFALNPAGLVRSVVRYDRRGVLVQWSVDI